MSYGIAIDIGTTTISASLLNLATGEVKRRFSSLNGQLSYGHDVISRINHALHKKNGLKRMTKSLVASLNYALENLIGKAGIGADNIACILAVGNSAMYHFLFSLPVDSFIVPPYKPFKTEEIETEASELGIEAAGKARFKMLPNIAGFIGSDAVSVILAAGIYKSEECVLAMDIGTNGEITLGSSDGISVVSTSAGPAFESWHISCGMRPVAGAIEQAEEIDGEIKLSVIGDVEPKGISGSGLIDLISILLRRGLIDKSGKLKGKKFVVCDNSTKIVITQKDIRETQLAKAAISVGTKFLRRKSEKGISKAFITGTFGNYINKENAREIGLVPDDIELDKIDFLRDGALTGAEMILRDPALEKDIEEILAKTEHVSLTEDKDFREEFASALHF